MRAIDAGKLRRRGPGAPYGRGFRGPRVYRRLQGQPLLSRRSVVWDLALPDRRQSL